MTSVAPGRFSPFADPAISCWPIEPMTQRALRGWLTERGTEPVIPPNPTRKNPHAYDRDAYRARNLIERMFCRLKDFRRIATRYDKRADIFLSAVCIAAAITWWVN
jgi:transposase